MAVPIHIRVRDARDRLIDLLGFGATAPLRDVYVEQEGLKVPVSTPAEIEIDPGQEGVQYLLRHRDGREVGELYVVEGTGTTTSLDTPEIEADITFKILARKTWGPGDLLPRETYLHSSASIKVGLDTTLTTRIIPNPGEPSDVTPPIIDYGAAVRVEVLLSQAGVDYELIMSQDGTADGDVVSLVTVPGNMATIVLDSIPMHDDVDLLVRVTRRFDSADNHEDEVDVLDTALPLHVRADPTLAVAVTDPIVDRLGETTITIGSTQANVHYQVLSRELGPRSDFTYDDAHENVIRVPVPGEPDVLVVPHIDLVDDYVGLGPAKAGTGGDLTFDLQRIADDTLLVVVAGKNHSGAPSTVQLEDAVVVLTRPNPHQELALTIPIEGGHMAGTMEVSGGQPGVFYHFRADAGGNDEGDPAYFPDQDELGVGVVRIGVDFVIAETGNPIVVFSRSELPAELSVRAVKAYTRVAASIANTAAISAGPEIKLDVEDIIVGAKARVVVTASIEGERYQPFLHGAPMRPVRIGNESDLVFVSDPLTDDASIVVRATTAPTHPGLAVERRVALGVNVWPALDAKALAPPLNTASTSDISARVVDWGSTVEVEIAATESRFGYELVDVSGSTPVVVSADAVAGTGGGVLLETLPLGEDVVLQVQAVKDVEVDGRRITRELVLQPALPIAVRANPGIALSVNETVVDHAGDVRVALTGSQRSANYTLYTRPIANDDMFPQGSEETLTVEIAGEPIRVLRMRTIGAGAFRPEAFTVVALPRPGTGERMEVDLSSIGSDVYVVATATKNHFGRETVVMLTQPQVILVRPDTDPALSLTADVSGGRITALLSSGGQPGVFYYFRNGAQGPEQTLPAYFHQRDDNGNIGIDRLRVDADFAVARGNGGDDAAPDPRLTFAEPGRLGTWHVRAVRALTGIEAPLGKTSRLRRLIKVVLETPQVAVNTPARVTIQSSDPVERYRLYRDGVEETSAVPGDGSDLILVTSPLRSSATLEVGAIRPAEPGIPSERRITLSVSVEAP